MSGLWSLPQAAPIVFRHLGAYAELAAQDLAVSREQFRIRIGSMMLAFVAALFALLMMCVAIVAAGWDTPYRMTAVYALTAFFVAIAIGAGIYFNRARLRQPPLFAAVRREWAIDRVILGRMLDGDETASTLASSKLRGVHNEQHA